MTRMELTGIKGVMALSISFVIYLIDVINEAVVVLVFFMMLDVINGLMRSWVTKSWDSTIGFAGVVKKLGVFVMIGVWLQLSNTWSWQQDKIPKD